ncbi:MAG TPA: HigA family addiction module antitoxin [Steroidobacteraceae bacterium]|nr:HigA family addiction module antitoxin [Steroidobacteraceae bacterium]
MVSERRPRLRGLDAASHAAAPSRRPTAAGRRPIHPGRFLDSRFLKPLALSQEAIARELGISRRRVNEIVNGRRGLTPDTALRLARYFGTGPELWLQLQAAWDLHLAQVQYRRDA